MSFVQNALNKMCMVTVCVCCYRVSVCSWGDVLGRWWRDRRGEVSDSVTPALRRRHFCATLTCTSSKIWSLNHSSAKHLLPPHRHINVLSVAQMMMTLTQGYKRILVFLLTLLQCHYTWVAHLQICFMCVANVVLVAQHFQNKCKSVSFWSINSDIDRRLWTREISKCKSSVYFHKVNDTSASEVTFFYFSIFYVPICF